jgi:sugar phosphate isomerase/epimerase
MTLLLTLTTGSVSALFKKGCTATDMQSIPALAMSNLGLRGLNIDAAQLGGWSPRDFDALRDQADKAACPCLVLVDRTMLKFGYDQASSDVSTDRVRRLAAAADRLGCNALSIVTDVPTDDEDNLEVAIGELRQVMTDVEARELNLLLAIGGGGTATADGLIDLVKQVGGFRIGVLPIFGEGDDPVEHLRRLAPYAGAVHMRVSGFSKDGVHTGADLAAGIDTLKRVGYQNTIAIEFTGKTKVEASIERARDVLQQAIELQDSE